MKNRLVPYSHLKISIDAKFQTFSNTPSPKPKKSFRVVIDTRIKRVITSCIGLIHA